MIALGYKYCEWSFDAATAAVVVVWLIGSTRCCSATISNEEVYGVIAVVADVLEL